jgi:hypothetical protein
MAPACHFGENGASGLGPGVQISPKCKLGDQELCHVQLLIRCVSRTDDLPGTLRRLRAADEELVEK